MDYQKVRDRFVQFFEAKGHRIVPSSSLIPQDDASVLLTTAGMQQFKPCFAGVDSPYGDLAISIQECFRLSDIDSVGDDTHLTFFEMFGNFAFRGEVSKEKAIVWAWEFLASPNWMAIGRDRITASYYNGNRAGTKADGEAKTALSKVDGLSRVTAQPDTENFWGPTGSEGPCGPTVEFSVDGVDVWHVVFNEFYCQPDGTLSPAVGGLGIDTGMGLERL